MHFTSLLQPNYSSYVFIRTM